MKVKFCVIVLIEIALVILLLVINLKKIERFAPAIGESLTFGRASPTLRSACKVQCNLTFRVAVLLLDPHHPQDPSHHLRHHHLAEFAEIK